MKRFEGMGAVRERGPRGYRIDAPEVQAACMLYAYREQLKKEGGHEAEVESIKITDPEANDPKLAMSATESWLTADVGGGSWRERFARYIESHPNEFLDTSDDAAIVGLLTELSPTIH